MAKLPKPKLLVVAILLCEGAGIIGSFFTTPAIASWYPTLQKPFFSPPNWLFAPVWSLLFLLMGVALYLVWRQKNGQPAVAKALKVFGFQLFLNVLWSVFFFGLRDPAAALMEIILLWGMIVYTIVLFAKVDKKAAWLLYPYLAWVSFAGLLNLAFWRLN